MWLKSWDKRLWPVGPISSYPAAFPSGTEVARAPAPSTLAGPSSTFFLVIVYPFWVVVEPFWVIDHRFGVVVDRKRVTDHP